MTETIILGVDISNTDGSIYFLFLENSCADISSSSQQHWLDPVPRLDYVMTSSNCIYICASDKTFQQNSEKGFRARASIASAAQIYNKWF